MPEYLVTWQMDVKARTPQAAAIEAHQAQRRRGTLATVFDVTNSKGKIKRIDLTALGVELCDDCGCVLEGKNTLSCPDGAIICRDCFDAGHH